MTAEDAPVYVGAHVSIAPYCTFVTVSSANNGTTINENSYVKKVVTKKASINIADNV